MCTLIWWVRPGKRLSSGLVYSTAWVAALLPWLDAMIVDLDGWSYAPTEIRIGEMPLALYLGWVIAWGIVAPLLAEALARLECRTVAVHPGGDHTVVVAEVLSAEAADGDPLLYVDGGYRGLAE